MASESIRPSASWAIDSEPIQARGIIVKQASAPISKSSFSWFLKKTIENKIKQANKQANKQAKGKERKTNKQAKKKNDDLWGLWMAKKSRATLWTNKILDQNRCQLVAAVVTSLDLFFFFLVPKPRGILS